MAAAGVATLPVATGVGSPGGILPLPLISISPPRNQSPLALPPLVAGVDSSARILPASVISGSPVLPQSSSIPSFKPNSSKQWSDIAQSTSSSLPSVNPIFTVSAGVAEASIPADLLSDPEPLWEACIIGLFVGDALHICKVHATVNRIWGNVERKLRIDAQFLNASAVLFLIAYSRTRFKVDFRNVPDSLFARKGLSFLSNIVGKGIKLHPNTERYTRLDVARVLTEVNLEKPLTNMIKLKEFPENEIQVTYPWLPLKCTSCNIWGHKQVNCTCTPGNIVSSGPSSPLFVSGQSDSGKEQQTVSSPVATFSPKTRPSQQN